MTDITSRAPRDAALVSAVHEAVEARFPTTLQTLTDLVAIPGIAWDSADRTQLERSAEAVAGLLREAGLQHVEIVTETRDDGRPGTQAVALLPA